MKQYKPNPLKPKDTNMWSSVNITGWNLGGESNIQTQFSYTAKLNSMLNRRVPRPKELTNGKILSFLNYQSIPTLADYGKVTVNPAGVAVYIDTTTTPNKVVYTDNLRESLVSAYNARSYIINKQLTHLRIASDNFGIAKKIDFPVIMSYMLALIYNTQTLVMPALHFKSLMGFLDHLEGFSSQAATNITAIRNKFMQNKFIKVCNQYLDMVSNVPLHSTTIESLIEFMTIEKLNDAFNTSYDYTTIEDTITRYSTADRDYAGIFNIDDNGAESSILLDDKIGQQPLFKDRQYLLNMLKLINVDAASLSTMLSANDTESVNKLVDQFIDYFNAAISAISALPTVFGPFYEAAPFLSEFIDTNIFKVRNIKDLELPIRKSCYYAKGAPIANISLKASANGGYYPTYEATVPLYNGSLEPSDTYKGNGLLYIAVQGWNGVVNANQMYVPFVDITEMQLKQFYTFVNSDIKLLDYLESMNNGYGTEKISYVTGNIKGILDMYRTSVNGSGVSGISELLVKSNVFSTDVTSQKPYDSMVCNIVNPIVHWASTKSDYIAVKRTSAGSGTAQTMIFTSPLLTGVRTVEMLPIDDTIRKATPTLVGIKAVPHIK